MVPGRAGPVALPRDAPPGQSGDVTATDTAPVSIPEPGYDALAADGAIVRIRPVTAADRPALADLYRRGSEDSRYRRFLSAGYGGLDEELDRLTPPAADEHQ